MKPFLSLPCFSVSAIVMAAFIAAVTNSPVLASPIPVRYTVALYGSIDDLGGTAVVRQINSFKEVAGGFKLPDQPKASKAFILTADGFEGLTGDMSVDFSAAFGLNDRNEVVGALNTITAMRPFRETRGQPLRLLPVLAGDSAGIAYDINDAGHAAGYSSGKAGMRAVWWGPANDIHVLQGLPGAPHYALALNDEGDIVGVTGGASKHGVLWPGKGVPVNLGTLPGFFGSEAVSINNKGEIVGLATGTNADLNLSRAVLWSPMGQAIVELGVLSGGEYSRARDINDSSEVVGTSNSTGGNRAFIWNAVEGMLDINALVATPGIVLTDAVGINKNGDIVAIGHTFDPSHPVDSHEEHELPRLIFVLTKVQ